MIINYFELNKSEGKRVVANFLEYTNNKLNNSIKYICYDDACHIAQLNDTLKDKIFVIDRFHIKNHVQKKCQTIHNCSSYPEFKNINTEVCEQKFSILSRYSHQ